MPLARSNTSARCPYHMLGLGRNATIADVQSAYRRLSLEVHPDKRPGDPRAHEAFQALTKAKDTLLTQKRRAEAEAWSRSIAAQTAAKRVVAAKGRGVVIQRVAVPRGGRHRRPGSKSPKGGLPTSSPSRSPCSASSGSLTPPRSPYSGLPSRSPGWPSPPPVARSARWRSKQSGNRLFNDIFGGTSLGARPAQATCFFGSKARPGELFIKVDNEFGIPITGCYMPTSATVLSLKEFVRDSLNVPIFRQFFCFGQKALLDIDKLADLGDPVAVSFKTLPYKLEASTALQEAVSRGSIEAVGQALQASADPNAVTQSGEFLLHIAAQQGSCELARFLCAARADVHRVRSTDTGETALTFASVAGHTEVVHFLCIANAGLDRATPTGLTPLSSACAARQTKVIRLLCEMGADKDIPVHSEGTPLYHAARTGDLNVVACLCQARADLSKTAKNGVTPLHIAAIRGHRAVVQCLLGAKADINQPTEIGDTPLIAAASGGQLEVARLLCGASAAVNKAEGPDGITPLCMAASHGHVGVVLFLWEEAGADATIARSDGKTPVHVLWDKGLCDVARVLERGRESGETEASGSESIDEKPVSASSAALSSLDSKFVTPVVVAVFAEAVELTLPDVLDNVAYTVDSTVPSISASSGADRPHVTWLTQHSVVVHGLPSAATIGLRVSALVQPGDSAVVGPWVETETADVAFGPLQGSDFDPDGQRRHGCMRSGCDCFARGDLQDPFLDDRLMPRCYRCGLHFEEHELLAPREYSKKRSSRTIGVFAVYRAPPSLPNCSTCCPLPALFQICDLIKGG